MITSIQFPPRPSAPNKNPTSEILFTSVSDYHKDGSYVIKAFGIYLTVVKNRVHYRIKPFVDIEVLDSDAEAEVSLVAASCNGTHPVVTTVEGRYLIGISPVVNWTRYTFGTLGPEIHFIRGIQQLYADGKLRKSNDKRYDYMIVAAQQHGFSLSVWNKLKGNHTQVMMKMFLT